jgi:hypothetical protein
LRREEAGLLRRALQVAGIHIAIRAHASRGQGLYGDSGTVFSGVGDKFKPDAKGEVIMQVTGNGRSGFANCVPEGDPRAKQ